MRTDINAEIAIRRAQVYQFLATAYLYPNENWTDDLPLLAGITHELEVPELAAEGFDLERLQSEHRHMLGLTGSLCYETEYGLPHEFRQSQELADIAGFYHAFGFTVGGRVRERPDHLAAELEFMYVLALKEAYALQNGMAEQADVCVEAQRTFLRDHLGQWISLFAEALSRTVAGSPYTALACFTKDFVYHDAGRLALTLEQPHFADVQPTPLGPELSCDGCAAADSLK